MKQHHLKALIKEIAVHALKEGRIQDPTKEEMMEYLRKQYGREDAWQDEAEVAIYWFANFYHGGQSSNLYSVLSTSPFNPGPIANGPEKDSMEELMYEDLVDEFGGSVRESVNLKREKHPNDIYDKAVINKAHIQFDKEIKDIQNAGKGDISFGYIGNYWTDPRYQPQDDRAWYIWMGKQKFGGYATKDLPQMWEDWQKAKQKFLSNQSPESIRELHGDKGKKYIVHYAVRGLEQIEPTKHADRQEAIKAARDFIQSLVTPKAKKAGEYVEVVKNGYIVKHVGGGTVAAATIEGETMFQESAGLNKDKLLVKAYTMLQENADNFDVNKYKLLKKAYTKAVQQKQTSFQFQGKPMQTEYAKYMLQYLAPRFDHIKEAYIPSPESIVEYIKPLPGAKAFALNTSHEGTQKFEVCIGKLSNGKHGLAIYAYRGDFAISIEHFNDVYGSLL